MHEDSAAIRPTKGTWEPRNKHRTTNQDEILMPTWNRKLAGRYSIGPHIHLWHEGPSRVARDRATSETSRQDFMVPCPLSDLRMLSYAGILLS